MDEIGRAELKAAKKMANQRQEVVERLRKELTELQAKLDASDEAVNEELTDRDNAVEWADKLAAAIDNGEGFIGEHSNVNNPWKGAVELCEIMQDELVRLRAAVKPVPGEPPSGENYRAKPVFVDAFLMTGPHGMNSDGWPPWMVEAEELEQLKRGGAAVVDVERIYDPEKGDREIPHFALLAAAEYLTHLIAQQSGLGYEAALEAIALGAMSYRKPTD